LLQGLVGSSALQQVALYSPEKVDKFKKSGRWVFFVRGKIPNPPKRPFPL